MSNNNNFTINSKFADLLDEKYIVPLYIISQIRGYSRIDDYILALIESKIQAFLDTSDTIEFDEFQQYIHRTIRGNDVPNEWVRSKEDEESDKKYVNVQIDRELVERLEKLEERRKKKQESNNQEDNTKKFVNDVNEGYYEAKKEQSEVNGNDPKWLI